MLENFKRILKISLFPTTFQIAFINICLTSLISLGIKVFVCDLRALFFALFKGLSNPRLIKVKIFRIFS